MKLYITPDTFIDTSKPIDISLSLSNTDENPRAWYVEKPEFEPVRTEHYTGSVAEGGSVNFRNIAFNPHGHGTHTECLGHITKEVHSVNKIVKEYFYKAQLISIEPRELKNNDGVVDSVIVEEQLNDLENVEALIIRTLPNSATKKSMNYSTKNPTYLDVACATKLIASGIKHLLVDTPSVDRENDNGELAFHHAFWEVPQNPNFERTISELVFVENEIEDGVYIVNFHLAPFENDATPSRPVLYKIIKA